MLISRARFLRLLNHTGRINVINCLLQFHCSLFLFLEHSSLQSTQWQETKGREKEDKWSGELKREECGGEKKL